eukprot:508580-Pelagomonas_calceolata.AAC.1
MSKGHTSTHVPLMKHLLAKIQTIFLLGTSKCGMKMYWTHVLLIKHLPASTQPCRLPGAHPSLTDNKHCKTHLVTMFFTATSCKHIAAQSP